MASAELPSLPPSPVLFEVRASSLLAQFGGCASLLDIPDGWLWQLRSRGVDVLYLLGVWQTGPAGIELSKEKLGSAGSFMAVSSPFAVYSFHAHADLGGDDALRQFRLRANRCGLRLMIDFVPNHVAKDHPWTLEEPWLLMQGTPEDAAMYPNRYFAVPKARTSVTATASAMVVTGQPFPDAATPGGSAGPASVDGSAMTTTSVLSTSGTDTPASGSSGAGASGVTYFAYGRDIKSGEGWKDTVQLNYWNSDLRRKMKQLLVWVASTGLADAVRCDMAMLVLRDVYAETWGPPPPRSDTCSTGSNLSSNPGKQPPPVLSLGSMNNAISPTGPPGGELGGTTLLLPQLDGSSAGAMPQTGKSIDSGAYGANTGTNNYDVEWWADTIAAVKAEKPHFLFLAEVYWEKEYTLLKNGFDFAYDKPFYDRVMGSSPEAVRIHLRAHLDYQRQCCRFIENHDERRALAAHRGALPGVKTAAVLQMASPGLRFIHDGQLEGRVVHHSMHVGPRPTEPLNLECLAFYRRLLRVTTEPEFKHGRWHLGVVTPSKDGNDTFTNIVATFTTPRWAPHAQDTAHLPAASSFPVLVGTSSASAPSTARCSGSVILPVPLAAECVPSATNGGPGTQPPLGGTTPPMARSDVMRSEVGEPLKRLDSVGTITSVTSDDSANTASTGATSISDTTTMTTSGSGMGRATSRGTDSHGSLEVAEFMSLAVGGAPHTGDIVPPPFVSLNAGSGLGGMSRTQSRSRNRMSPLPYAGRVFLVLANLSERASNGHVLFTRPDDSAMLTPEGQHSALAVQQLMLAASNVRTGFGFESLPIVADAVSDRSSSTPTRARVGFVDHLSDFYKEYPLALLEKEGWWVQLAPWAAHIFEILILRE